MQPDDTDTDHAARVQCLLLYRSDEQLLDLKQDAKAAPVKGKAAAKPAVGKKGVVRRSVDAVVDKVVLFS